MKSTCGKPFVNFLFCRPLQSVNEGLLKDKTNASANRILAHAQESVSDITEVLIVYDVLIKDGVRITDSNGSVEISDENIYQPVVSSAKAVIAQYGKRHRHSPNTAIRLI